MPPLREVRKRIRSVKNISQITRALEAVSASRVRRAQARVLASRAYAEKAWEILLNVQNASKGSVAHPMLTERQPINKIMIVLITSDRGLAGSYNTNVMRVAERFEERMGKPCVYVAVGKKGRTTLVRMGKQVIAEFDDVPAEPRIRDIAPIVRLARDAYLSGEVDEVVIAYTDFINMLAQKPTVKGWLPMTTHSEAGMVAGDLLKPPPEVTAGNLSYEYEPDAETVLDEIVPRFAELQMYQALLEAQASEHAARMAAMRSATDNASQLVADLTLEYNKARQAAITSEILDIVGGANALQMNIESLADSIEADMMRAVRPAMVQTPVAPQATSPVQAAPKPAAAPVAEAVLEEEAPRVKRGKREGDDLTLLDGIGPKISKALMAAGVTTFVILATKTEAELRGILEAAEINLAPSLPSWPQQAALAAAGDMDGLKRLIESMKGR